MSGIIDHSPQFYEDLEKSLPDSREALLKTFTLGQNDDVVRPLDQAQMILGALRDIHHKLGQLFKLHPPLATLFEKEFLPFNHFNDRQTIVETCFLDSYLIPEQGSFYLGPSGPPEANEGAKKLAFDLEQHKEIFDQWIEKVGGTHRETQEFLRNNFNPDTQAKQLKCPCMRCLGDYRNILRDSIYQQCQKLIDTCQEEIQQQLESQDISTLGRKVFQLQKTIDQILQANRSRLKRSSLNKLEKQLKNNLKAQFSYDSPLGSEFVKKLITPMKNHLIKEKLSPELIDEAEYQRFFQQLGANLFKEESYLLREFDKLVKSVLRLKTQDISAKILQDYLGQFWLHSRARRLNRKIVYHMGPTNSGKTYHAINALCKASSGCYLAPLRLLAGELYDTMNARGVPTTLLTGEEVIDTQGARHFSSTIEMARLKEPFECAVIDEIQMMADPQRGWAWTRALVSLEAEVVHVCGDDSALSLVENIVEKTGDTLEIKRYQRLTELVVMDNPISLGQMEKGDALIVFSRRNALKYKGDLERLGLKVSIIYGRLGPEVRREQARKFDEGETDVIVSTDAIAMGMNLPIRRIVFSTLSKYIDDKERFISKSEIKQIAGRAGRFQRFPTGHVTTLARVEKGIEKVNNAIEGELEQKPLSMVGPDLEIYGQVNNALNEHNLPVLLLSEFLRLFNTMTFTRPFFCVDLKEMIELAEMVENSNQKYRTLNISEIFGFACAPVNMGLMEHVQYYVYILNNYIRSHPIDYEPIDATSDDIDYLETSIKCTELFQWLARHFNQKNFDFKESELANNKSKAIEKLNTLLSDRIVPNCSSCGQKLGPDFKFNICESCFKARRFTRRKKRFPGPSNRDSEKRVGPGRSRSPKASRQGKGSGNAKSSGNKRGKGRYRGPSSK